MRDMKINAPMATRYERYASLFGVHFPSRQDQKAYGKASTDQGNVSYEIPAIQGAFYIESQNEADNHTLEFAEVSPVGE